jgi:DNA replication ATP-dependent helicase Dna2
MREKDLLNNWRRVNVACTRAKRKLLFVGSEKELRDLAIMDQFLDLMTEKDWIFNFDKHYMKNI